MRNTNEDYMQRLWAQYDAYQKLKLSLDVTRGNPSPEQLDLSNPMRAIMEYHAADGSDCRNYNAKHFCGLPEVRKLCARYLGTRWQETIVYGNSSLNLMADIIYWAKRSKWGSVDRPKFLCFVPGYDRHFEMLSKCGITLIPIAMREDGPNLDEVRNYIKDPSVVGMIMVPKYSNPTGNTFTQKVACQIVSLKPACRDLVVIVDDAYRHHNFTSTPDRPVDFLKLAKEQKTEDRFFVFGSFSKVTLAGSALAMMSVSPRNFATYSQVLKAETIGPDKLRQLQHVFFLKNMTGIKAHMRKHRRIVEPKFHAVYEVLEEKIGGKSIALWSKPEGGYFILLRLHYGSAQRAWQLAEGLGVKFTQPGAPFVTGRDPDDCHLRLAPTYLSTRDLRLATQVLALCLEISHREKFPDKNR